jgi:hypothetical protein
MDAISSLPPHSISLGGLRTPAPGVRRAAIMGRHPKTFTYSDIRAALNFYVFHLELIVNVLSTSGIF